MRILVVEDEAQIAASLCTTLESEGFVAELATDGNTAWEQGSTELYAAAILDIGLPELDGLSVLRNWRAEGIDIPVILLSAKSSWNERVDGIDAGADDYLVKPFQMEELLARIRALLRRNLKQKSTVLTAGSLRLDVRNMKISCDGRPVKTTPLEYRLLSYLMHNQGTVVSQPVLAENIYFRDQEPDSNSIEVLVGRLRRKLGTGIIETRRGFGYVIPDNPS